MIDLTTWGIIRPTETDASGALRRRFALYLLPAYLHDPVKIARVCDEQVDPSGRLLGYVRDLANDPAIEDWERKGVGPFARTGAEHVSDPSLAWSYTPPVVADWYWWQGSISEPTIIVRYFYDKGWWLMSRGLLVSAKNQSGRFCGPIPAPYAFATWEPSR